jgi:hypothetical protein
LPSTEYVIDEHSPFAPVAVHTLIELPSEQVLPVVQVPSLLVVVPPDPEPELDPVPHAVVACASACAQSAQVAHWNVPTPVSYVTLMHTPFESWLVQTCAPSHSPLAAHDLLSLPPEVEEHAAAMTSRPAPTRKDRPLMHRTT